MKLEEIRNVAKSRGIHSAKLSKTELVKSIQRAEGNVDCFANAHADKCDQAGCSWRKDCLESGSKAGRSLTRWMG